MQAVKSDLGRWFGSGLTDNLKLLRIYRIPFAQPNQEPPTDLLQDPSVGSGIFLCGDHCTAATLEGALQSGLRAADAVLAH